MNRKLQNPSAIGRTRTRSSPLPKRPGRNKGNAPWLKVRMRLRKPAFRNL